MNWMILLTTSSGTGYLAVSGQAEEGRLAVSDRLFLGEGLFETLRVTQSACCYPELHWQRLCCSAKFLGIDFDWPLQTWKNRLQQCIKDDGIEEGGIKVILTGGTAFRGLTAKGKQGQLLLHSFQYSRQEKPLRLARSHWLRDARNPVYQLKSVNYLEAILARRQAEAVGADDVLFFNTEQHVSETSCANIFFIRDNSVLTPPLADGVLPGITRQRLIAACLRLNIPCIEQSLTEQDVCDAEAVFLTNALQGIQRVGSIEQWTFAMEHSVLDKLGAVIY